MKTILIAFLASATIARADIIQVFDNFDFYRGREAKGWLALHPLTAVFSKAWEGQINEIDQFVSFYKLGNNTGGFHTDFAANDPTDTATIGWDLPTASTMPELGYDAPLIRMRAVEVIGQSGADELFYVTPGRNVFKGELTFTLPNHDPINTIYLWGGSRVPDNGATILLLGVSLAGLVGFQISKTSKGTKQ